LLFEWPPFSKVTFIRMFEASYMLAFFGASILLAAAAAWWNISANRTEKSLCGGLAELRPCEVSGDCQRHRFGG
jgi:hypothetical protein